MGRQSCRRLPACVAGICAKSPMSQTVGRFKAGNANDGASSQAEARTPLPTVRGAAPEPACRAACRAALKLAVRPRLCRDVFAIEPMALQRFHCLFNACSLPFAMGATRRRPHCRPSNCAETPLSMSKSWLHSVPALHLAQVAVLVESNPKTLEPIPSPACC